MSPIITRAGLHRSKWSVGKSSHVRMSLVCCTFARGDNRRQEVIKESGQIRAMLYLHCLLSAYLHAAVRNTRNYLLISPERTSYTTCRRPFASSLKTTKESCYHTGPYRVDPITDLWLPATPSLLPATRESSLFCSVTGILEAN